LGKLPLDYVPDFKSSVFEKIIVLVLKKRAYISFDCLICHT